MKIIKKIVITGGPCGGKTTALEKIGEVAKREGYKAIIAAETATELLTAGLHYLDDKCGSYIFQKALNDLQIAKETVYFEAAQNMQYDKVLIVCDRSLIDPKAYMSEENYLKVLSPLSYEDALNRYDAAFHLRTAALGAEDYYTLENNATRIETIPQAIELDEKVVDAWKPHSNFAIIENGCTFDEKLDILFNKVKEILNK